MLHSLRICQIYYHVTIVETTCVILKLLKIYLNVVLKFMLNLCRGSYAAFLLKTATPVFNLMECQPSGS